MVLISSRFFPVSNWNVFKVFFFLLQIIYIFVNSKHCRGNCVGNNIFKLAIQKVVNSETKFNILEAVNLPRWIIWHYITQKIRVRITWLKTISYEVFRFTTWILFFFLSLTLTRTTQLNISILQVTFASLLNIL